MGPRSGVIIPPPFVIPPFEVHVVHRTVAPILILITAMTLALPGAASRPPTAQGLVDIWVTRALRSFAPNYS